MNGASSLHAFRAFGIELEYMIVDREDLAIRPIADQWLHQIAGANVNDVERGMLGWSNELALHVIELKNLRPSTMLQVLPTAFQSEIKFANRTLAPMGARLMPGAMHPWMNPQQESQLWPHHHAELYRTYDRIFDTKSHGWSNLQSMHINLPFANDQEFARLHAAIRIVLPLLPAIAASSPIADGKDTGFADFRMEVYRHNAASFPAIAGQIIPENITNKESYQQLILQPMYNQIASHDPEMVLRHEWLNSRGAIARFDRNAIEIRVIDTQECPKADLAIAAATIAAVKALYMEEWSSLASQQALSTEELARIFQACVRDGEKTLIDNPRFLQVLGMPGRHCKASELWQFLIEEKLHGHIGGSMAWNETLQILLRQGPLARRIVRAIGGDFSPAHLRNVYRGLCDCLEDGTIFQG